MNRLEILVASFILVLCACHHRSPEQKNAEAEMCFDFINVDPIMEAACPRPEQRAEIIYSHPGTIDRSIPTLICRCPDPKPNR